MVEDGSYNGGEIEHQTTGRVRYDIEGTGIEVAWKEFQPVISSEIGEPLNPHKAVVFLPGWGYVPEARVLAPLVQELANYSHTKAYALDTYTERGLPHSLVKETKADQQFLEEEGIQETTIAGSSQGGAQAMYLTELVQAHMRVNGLILIDSMGMYNQPLSEFIPNYVRDNIHTLRPQYSRTDDVATLKKRNATYMQDMSAELGRQIRLAGGIHRYPKRILSEIKEMLTVNPAAQEIKVPIVIVHGTKDLYTQAKKIIPHQEDQQASYIQDIHEREQFLQEHLFPKSPSVKMVLAEKVGYHALPALRPEQVAKTSLYLLDRFHRTQQQQSSAR